MVIDLDCDRVDFVGSLEYVDHHQLSSSLSTVWDPSTVVADPQLGLGN